MIIATREDIAEQLWLREEPELAVAMLDADDAMHRRVLEAASRFRLATLFRNTVDDHLVAGAIEVLDGRRRRPKRGRPLSDDYAAGLWQRVGPERDTRTPDDVLPDLVRVLKEDWSL